MGFREWNAVVALVSTLAGLGWLAVTVLAGPPAELAPAAMQMVIAIGVLVGVNIVGIIAAVIGVGIATREKLRDEKADERDLLIAAKAMRNAYYIASAGGALTLLAIALGVSPVLAIHGLFGALLLAGGTEAASLLLYYRTQ